MNAYWYRCKRSKRVSSIAELQVNGSSSEYLAKLIKLAERVNQ